MIPDSDLVFRIWQGDTDAYEPLVRRYERAAMIVALPILKDYHRAEEVVQDSFVIAYQRLPSLRDASKFGPWLMRITRREATRRARKHRTNVSLDSIAEPASPKRVARPSVRYEELIRLMGCLPVHERLVVTLHHLNGCSVRTIAAVTGRPVGTVTKQLSRAMHRLRKWLQ